MAESNTERRAALIASLRACADFLESHPGVPAPVYTEMNAFVDTRDDIAAAARAAARWEKRYSGTYFSLRRVFGEDLALEINAARDTVCRKVVTGTQVVPAQPEHTVETFEWVCDETALLGQTPETVEV